MKNNLLLIYRIVPQPRHLRGETPIVLKLSDHYQVLRLLDNTLIVSKLPQRNVQQYSTFRCYKALLNYYVLAYNQRLLSKLRVGTQGLLSGLSESVDARAYEDVRKYIDLAGRQRHPFGYQTARNEYKIHYLSFDNGDLLEYFSGFYKTDKIVRSLLYPLEQNIYPLSDQLIRTSHDFLTYERFSAIYAQVYSSFLVCIKQPGAFYEVKPHQMDDVVCQGISLCDGNNSLDISDVSNAMYNGHLFVFFHGQDTVTVRQVNFQHLHLFAPHARALSGDGCGFDTVELRNCQRLQKLDVSENHIATLCLCGYLELRELQIQRNCLVNLEIDACTALVRIDCSHNQLQSIQITRCNALTYFDASHNQIERIDLDALTELEALFMYQNKLTKIDCSNCTKITEANASANYLTDANFQGCTHLEQLFLQQNCLTYLDLRRCSDLRVLWAFNNQLSTLVVKECPNLAIMWVYENPDLKEVIVMNCIALVEVLVDDQDILIE